MTDLIVELIDIIIRALGPDKAKQKLEERIAILAARAAADAQAEIKFK